MVRSWVAVHIDQGTAVEFRAHQFHSLDPPGTGVLGKALKMTGRIVLYTAVAINAYLQSQAANLNTKPEVVYSPTLICISLPFVSS